MARGREGTQLSLSLSWHVLFSLVTVAPSNFVYINRLAGCALLSQICLFVHKYACPHMKIPGFSQQAHLHGNEAPLKYSCEWKSSLCTTRSVARCCPKCVTEG